MTARTFTADEAEAYGRLVVTGRSLGYCQLSHGQDGAHPGREWAHRVARGRGGTWAPVNGLLLCRLHHSLSHAAQDMSRACGWMVPTGVHPSTVPALIWTQAGPGWFWLDELDPGTGRSAGLASWCDPSDVPPGMWTGSLDEAIRELHARGGATRSLSASIRESYRASGAL